MALNAKRFPKFVEPAVQVVPDHAHAFSGFERNFFRRQALVVNQLNGAALPRLQGLEYLTNKNAILSRGLPAGCSVESRQTIFKGISFKESVGYLRATAIESSMVGKHQQPGFEVSLLGIKLMDRAKHIQENLLHRILSLGIIPQHPARNSKHQGTVTLKQDCQRLCISTLQLIGQVLIGAQMLLEAAQETYFPGRSGGQNLFKAPICIGGESAIRF